ALEREETEVLHELDPLILLLQRRCRVDVLKREMHEEFDRVVEHEHGQSIERMWSSRLLDATFVEVADQRETGTDGLRVERHRATSTRASCSSARRWPSSPERSAPRVRRRTIGPSRPSCRPRGR